MTKVKNTLLCIAVILPIVILGILHIVYPNNKNVIEIGTGIGLLGNV